MTRTDIEAVVRGLTKAQREALLKPNVDGLAELSDHQIDKMIQLGLAYEFDIPALGGWADDPAAIEMRRLGIAMVAHTWTPLALAVRNHLKATQEDQPC